MMNLPRWEQELCDEDLSGWWKTSEASFYRFRQSKKNTKVRAQSFNTLHCPKFWTPMGEKMG